jgi:glycosyltransferase involved in cell wall biosynthesis
MRPIRLAVIFDQLVESGGGYQQALSSALLTKNLPKELTKVLFFTLFEENVEILASYGIKAEVIKLSLFEKIRNSLRQKIENKYLFKLIKEIEEYSPYEKKLIKYQIDLVYFLSPICFQQSLDKLNYITTLWDLCHRDEPEFPEVRENKEFEKRDISYRNILPRATAILVDSETGKVNTAHRYGINLDRIHVLPFQPSKFASSDKNFNNCQSSEIYKKFKNEKYIFYPAQLWPHKNHFYILNGLLELEQKYGHRISAIFSGTDKGNKKYIESYATKKKIEDRIHFVGFVSNKEMKELYQQSIALVMPSYFGPTNLPPLEAFQLGVPVLCSDIPGTYDQVGDAALLMNLKNPNSMALCLKNLIESKKLREQLINAGFERLEHLKKNDQVYVLKNIIENFRFKRLSWN